MAAHAEYGGSAAPRWANCPGSVALSRGLPRVGSEAAKDGVLKHALAEYCLKTGIDAALAVAQGFEHNVAGEGEAADVRRATEEHAAPVQVYLDYCRDLEGEHFVEVRVAFDPWVPGNWGFIDHAAIHGKVVTLTDAKFGGDIVQADTEQLELYAIGFYEEYSLLYEIEEFVLRVCQPARDHFDERRITVDELLRRAEFYHERWRLSQQPDAPLIPGQKQCKYCPANDPRIGQSCPAVAKLTEAVVSAELDEIEAIEAGSITVANADTVSLEMAERLVQHQELITKFLSKLHERVKTACLHGEPMKLFKVVAGKRGNREWKDPEEAEKVLKSMRLKDEQMYTKKLATPAQVEKHVGPRQRKKLDQLITRSSGNPTLVPMSDPRPAIAAVKDELSDDTDIADDLDFGLD